MNDYEPTDPDEICLHCGALIDSNYRICPVCGRVWYVEDENERTRDRGQHKTAVQDEKHHTACARRGHRRWLGDDEQVG